MRRITGVTFDPNSTQITYQEDHEANEKAIQFRMVVVQNNQIEVHLAEVEECLQDMLNDALVCVRNPPDGF